MASAWFTLGLIGNNVRNANGTQNNYLTRYENIRKEFDNMKTVTVTDLCKNLKISAVPRLNTFMLQRANSNQTDVENATSSTPYVVISSASFVAPSSSSSVAPSSASSAAPSPKNLESHKNSQTVTCGSNCPLSRRDKEKREKKKEKEKLRVEREREKKKKRSGKVG
ncbi:hypothetical protein KQX54_016740 [Cotesia glomerata]|uniref:Uncharacterized protein n=1 Tax=Cotesia glomerata TaxID=32391 RepID=A0AAV7ISX4_COTGL|nr:hypothetical protein KQX54_016740 [Cotesia glomerata]